MPDWYVRRNEEGSTFPYQIRLGGCEYSLTEAEWSELIYAFQAVEETSVPVCIESEDYQDIVIASGDAKKSLSSIMGHSPREPMKRRI